MASIYHFRSDLSIIFFTFPFKSASAPAGKKAAPWLQKIPPESPHTPQFPRDYIHLLTPRYLRFLNNTTRNQITSKGPINGLKRVKSPPITVNIKIKTTIKTTGIMNRFQPWLRSYIWNPPSLRSFFS